jgi:hypothetical protein
MLARITTNQLRELMLDDAVIFFLGNRAYCRRRIWRN